VRPRAPGYASAVVIRAILGEDDYLAREGISRALETLTDVELVDAFEDADSLFRAVEELTPDVVLTDIRMPPTHSDEGIRLAARLRTSHPAVGVVVLSQFADPVYAMALFESGSAGRGYLLKERVRNRDDLGRALREVAAGGSVVDARIVESLVEAERLRQRTRLNQLTSRELEILSLIAQGWSNTAIADTLVITKRAVEGHIGAIFTTLDLGPSAEVSRRVKAALMYLAGQGDLAP
jgi:DNA-binding NarL/FixJ family response regulator